MKPVRKQRRGFTMVEVLVSMTILAMLMTAVAFAFDAAVTNFEENRGIYETVNRARQSLLRITTDLRTASDIALDADDSPNEDTQISLFTNGGDNVTYRYNSADDTLYYDDHNSGNSYTLCENVTAMTFDRTEVTIQRDTNNDGVLESVPAIRDVRIVLTVADDAGKVEKTLAAATLIRRNM